MKERGKQLVKVGRFFASSQLCSVCGYKNSGTRVCVLCTVCSNRNIEKTVGHTGIARLCLAQWCHRTRTDGPLLRKEAHASIGGGGCHFCTSSYSFTFSSYSSLLSMVCFTI
ncbi:zinc ribbon domain-containing protein [Fusicatenibacter sp.]